MTTTASTEDKLSFIRSIPNTGPTHAVNYKTQDFEAEVKKVTDGKGVDVLVDFVGQSHWQKNIDSLAIDGRMTLVALLSGSPNFLVISFNYQDLTNIACRYDRLQL